MDEGLPAAVREAAADRRGGATEVAARALDGLLEVAGDPRRLEAAVAALLAGQPAMAPVWHLARAARGPDPHAALARLRDRLAADADAAADAAAAWLRPRLAGGGRAAVATVSHSSLVDRVLARLPPGEAAPLGPGSAGEARPGPGGSGGGDPAAARPGPGPGPASPGPDPGPARPVVGLVGADAIGPEAFLNAAGTGGLAARLPTLVVATAIKLLPAEAFARLAGPGFEVVPLRAAAAVVVGPAVLSPIEAGRLAASA
jgi:hypothetical protein